MGIELVAVLLVATFTVVATLVASWRHHVKMKAFLQRPFNIAREIRESVGKLVNIDDAGVATLTLFDVLYTAVKLNPNALRHLAGLDESIEVSGSGELLTALEAAGASPDATDQVWSSLDFLEAQTDMAIYTPVEQASIFGGDPIGVSDSALDIADVGNATLADGGLLEFHDFSLLFLHIPLISIAVKSARNWQKANEGRITSTEAIEETVLDTATLTVGGLGGLALGTKIGAILAPATGGASLIIAPAIFSALGILTGGAIGRSLKEDKYGVAYRKAKARYDAMLSASNRCFTNFRQAFISCFGEIKAKLQHRHRSNLQLLRVRGSELEPGPKRVLFPSPVSKLIQMSIAEMKREFRTYTMPVYKRLHSEIRATGPESGGRLLYAQGKTYLVGIQQLEELYDQADASLANLREAKVHVEEEHAALQRKLGR